MSMLYLMYCTCWIVHEKYKQYSIIATMAHHRHLYVGDHSMVLAGAITIKGTGTQLKCVYHGIDGNPRFWAEERYTKKPRQPPPPLPPQFIPWQYSRMTVAHVLYCLQNLAPKAEMFLRHWGVLRFGKIYHFYLFLKNCLHTLRPSQQSSKIKSS